MNLKLRRLLVQHFDCAIKLHSFKRMILKNLKVENKSNVNIIKEILVCFEYRLDVLLYRLNFFASTYEARKYISLGHILVNEKSCLKYNYIAKKGDIIRIVHVKPILSELLTRKQQILHFNSFLEVDYYSKTVIVVKNLAEITSLDLALISPLQVRASRLYQAFYHK